MRNVTVAQLYDAVGHWAPWDSAEAWDNVGVLVHGGDEEISGICCALDITSDTVQWAAKNGCNLIFSHHPVIFHPMKSLDYKSVPAELLRHGITAVCAHTNLDKARDGVCETLANKIGLKNVRPGEDFLYLGEVESPMNVAQLTERVQTSLQAPVCWVSGEKNIKTVAVVSGAGGDFWEQAQNAGAECLVTGEMRHHEALDARQAGMSVIAATHYGTERWIVPVMASFFHRVFPQVPVFQWDFSQTDNTKDPMQYRMMK
ncbi:Nif3-like dinuclear metal center hexameric protein [uncultured Ruthenibacterium sp.]|uniref:Nif3-like dinuclear metal center hexameric protein n=1 Tax=uncultured Ruthenibacterium sp. TaxID=1905347 RepID=UPI00349EB4A7